MQGYLTFAQLRRMESQSVGETTAKGNLTPHHSRHLATALSIYIRLKNFSPFNSHAIEFLLNGGSRVVILCSIVLAITHPFSERIQ